MKLALRLLSSLLLVAPTAASAFEFGATSNAQTAVRADSQTPRLPLGFHIYLPPDYDDVSLTPLVIWLHGHGEQGNGTTQLGLVTANQGLPRAIRRHLAGESNPDVNLAPGGVRLPILDAIVVSPQGRWEYEAETPALLNELLDVLLDAYAIDPARVYITGWSYGGGGAIIYARRYPERIAALAPFSGSNTNTANANLSAVPIWAFMSLYEAAPLGTTFRPMSWGVRITRSPNGDILDGFPWTFNSNGTVYNPPPPSPNNPNPPTEPTASMAVYRQSTGKWTWYTSGALLDFSGDPDVTGMYSGPLSSDHAAAWKLAFGSEVFWRWLFKQRKSTPGNHPPTMSSIGNITMTVGDVSQSVLIDCNDIDGDALTLSFTAALPDFVLLNATGNGDGELIVTPEPGDEGSYTLTAVVTDTGGLTASRTFTIDVMPVSSGSTNVALGKSVVVSSTYSSAYPGALAIDGVVSDASRWLSASEANPWIAIDLGGEYEIERVVLRTGYGSGFALPAGHVEVLAGGQWAQVAGLAFAGNAANNHTVELWPTASVVTSQVLVVGDVTDVMRVREIEVYGVPAAPPEPVLLSQGMPVSASSVYGNYPAHFAVDGIVSDTSRWVSQSGSPGSQWLAIDLGVQRTLTHARLFTGYANNFAIGSARLEAWNGTTWQVINGGAFSGNPETQQVVELTFTAPVQTSRVRMVGYDNGQLRVRELEIWGY